MKSDVAPARRAKALAHVRDLVRTVTDNQSIAEMISLRHGVELGAGEVARQRQLMISSGAMPEPQETEAPAEAEEPQELHLEEDPFEDDDDGSGPWSHKELEMETYRRRRHEHEMRSGSRMLAAAIARDAMRRGLLLPHMTRKGMFRLAMTDLSGPPPSAI